MSLLSEYKESKKVLSEFWPVIFFTEKKSDFQYLSHLFYLLKQEGVPLCYITSDNSDPLLIEKPDGVTIFYFKYLLGFIFNRLKARSVFLTMPDLQQFLYKRSAGVSEYVYVFHALVSTHQQYRPGAFDHYDTILCAGPHHEKEIRLREKKMNLPAKNLMPYGYPLLDHWPVRKEGLGIARITLAPSWYPGCIFETCFYQLAENLRKINCNISVRFHPEFVKRKRKKYNEIIKFIKSTDNITVDKEPDVRESLSKADLLITDRSGIAFEFALATQRPVLFINTPPKKFNSEADTLGLIPVEDSFRPRLGLCIRQDELDKIDKNMQALLNTKNSTLSFQREELAYNTSVNTMAIKEYFLKKIIGEYSH